MKQFKKKAKKQQGGFLSMLQRTLGASLSGNILAGKRAIVTSQRRSTSRAGEGIVRAGYGNKKTTKWIFYIAFWLNLKYKNKIKMNLDLMVFILEIIYPNAFPLK